MIWAKTQTIAKAAEHQKVTAAKYFHVLFISISGDKALGAADAGGGAEDVFKFGMLHGFAV
jgi:hypothetical protein